MYRVALPERHHDLARRYMVEAKLPHTRAAVLQMIEDAALKPTTQEEPPSSMKRQGSGDVTQERPAEAARSQSA